MWHKPTYLDPYTYIHAHGQAYTSNERITHDIRTLLYSRITIASQLTDWHASKFKTQKSVWDDPVWLEWAVFKRSLWQIFLRKISANICKMFCTILKNVIFWRKTASSLFWATVQNIWQLFIIPTSGHTVALLGCKYIEQKIGVGKVNVSTTVESSVNDDDYMHITSDDEMRRSSTVVASLGGDILTIIIVYVGASSAF